MANAQQIKALIRSHADGDDTRFYALAMQVAAHAARSGHSRFAQELRKLVETVREKSNATEQRGRVIHIAQPRGELARILSVTSPSARLDRHGARAPDVRKKLERVISEQRRPRTHPRTRARSPPAASLDRPAGDRQGSSLLRRWLESCRCRSSASSNWMRSSPSTLARRSKLPPALRRDPTNEGRLLVR